MDYAGSSSLFMDRSEDLLDYSFEISLYREDINSVLFAVIIFTVLKIVLKNRFKLFISTFLKLYGREQYLYFSIGIVLGLKSKYSL
jgi:hypothetical protein